jgi:hypothetical protein
MPDRWVAAGGRSPRRSSSRRGGTRPRKPALGDAQTSNGAPGRRSRPRERPGVVRRRRATRSGGAARRPAATPRCSRSATASTRPRGRPACPWRGRTSGPRRCPGGLAGARYADPLWRTGAGAGVVTEPRFVLTKLVLAPPTEAEARCAWRPRSRPASTPPGSWRAPDGAVIGPRSSAARGWATRAVPRTFDRARRRAPGWKPQVETAGGSRPRNASETHHPRAAHRDADALPRNPRRGAPLRSGRPGSNRRRPPWQGGTLPLSYSRETGRSMATVRAAVNSTPSPRGGTADRSGPTPMGVFAVAHAGGGLVGDSPRVRPDGDRRAPSPA